MPRARRHRRNVSGKGPRNQPTPLEDKSSREAKPAQNADVQSPASGPELLEQIERAASKGDMRLVQELIEVSTTYSGPIPPPAILRGYEDIVPGSADRIMGWAESQTKHRHKLETDRAR